MDIDLEHSIQFYFKIFLVVLFENSQILSLKNHFTILSGTDTLSLKSQNSIILNETHLVVLIFEIFRHEITHVALLLRLWTPCREN